MVLTIDAELVDAASFIFEGTVISSGRSTVLILRGVSNLAIVRFDRAIRVNPLLGDLTTQSITVGIGPGTTVDRGERLIFFANSWVHAEGIAVRSLGQFPAEERIETELDAALKAVPALQLERRIASARLIVHGKVESVEPADLRQPVSEHMATWMRARLGVTSVIKGSADSKSLSEVLFPENTDSSWRLWPKLKRGERGVFLLHVPARGPVPPGALVLPDPLDVQAISRANGIRDLVSPAPSGGGIQ